MKTLEEKRRILSKYDSMKSDYGEEFILSTLSKELIEKIRKNGELSIENLTDEEIDLVCEEVGISIEEMEQ